MFRACEFKDQTYKKTRTLHFSEILGEAKPGGLQTRGFPTFFGKGPDCVADPFGTVPRRCSYQRTTNQL